MTRREKVEHEDLLRRLESSYKQLNRTEHHYKGILVWGVIYGWVLGVAFFPCMESFVGKILYFIGTAIYLFGLYTESEKDLSEQRSKFTGFFKGELTISTDENQEVSGPVDILIRTDGSIRGRGENTKLGIYYIKDGFIDQRGDFGFDTDTASGEVLIRAGTIRKDYGTFLVAQFTVNVGEADYTGRFKIEKQLNEAMQDSLETAMLADLSREYSRRSGERKQIQ